MSSDRYKVKFGDSVAQEKVILPLSLGKSSLVLLDVLVGLFDEQTRNPRAKLGFEIVVVHVDDSNVTRYRNGAKDLIRALEEHYDTQRYPISFKVVDIQSFMHRGARAKVRLLPDFASSKSSLDHDGSTIEQIFEGCPNRASREDLLRIIIADLINKYAASMGASSILWGHGMSTLASEVIALTVKGRGSEIHTQLTDGVQIMLGRDIDIVHPLRDCSEGEIDKYITMKQLERFIHLPVDEQEKMMNKQKTIPEVITNYYRYVDGADDNIVSTVVKTGAKLDEPRSFNGKLCTVCGKKIYNEPENWLRAMTHKGSRGPEDDLERGLLEEWKETNNGPVEQVDSGEPVSMCFGCIVTVGGFSRSELQWPIEEKQSIQNILDEFIISDGEESNIE